MRRFVIFSFLFISVFVECSGSVMNDSVKVFFAINKATFDPVLYNESASMKEFIDGIVVSAKSGNIDSVVVRGYASPDGPFPNNDRLSIERCNSVADYISRHTGIPKKEIYTYPGGVAWDGLRTLVHENAATPCREEVLRVLDLFIPEACTSRVLSDKCMKSLIAIDNGRAYKWMLKNLFPELRFALAVYIYKKENTEFFPPPLRAGEDSDSVVVNTNYESEKIKLSVEPTFSKDSTDSDSIPSSEYTTSLNHKPLHKLAVKNNFLYDAVLLPNIEIELRINDKWSVSLDGDVAWWGKYSNEKSYRLVIVSPEVKRWIRTRAPWHGSYVGLFAGGGLYDFENHRRGYRGEGGMIGLSGGYMWPVGRCLSIEAAIGAGYLYTRYKEYKPLDGHHVHYRTKNLNYFGPLKLKFSLVWRLWDLNKSKRQSAVKQTTVQYEK